MNLKRRFIRAIAFCLASQYGGEEQAYEASAEWALSPGDGAPTPPHAGHKVALVSGGATKIKGYVFESARLPEIRGASGLLDRINLDDIPRLWRDLGCEDCIIYANGGEVLAFAPVGKAGWLADEVERLYTRETLVAQSVAVWQEFTLEQLRQGVLAGRPLSDEQKTTVKQLLGYIPTEHKTFGSLVASLALAKFRRREANRDQGRSLELRAIAHFETVPFARRCSSCERRMAVVNARVADENRPLCEPCARKRVFGQLAKKDEQMAVQWWYNEQFSWKPEGARSWGGVFEDWLGQHDDLKKEYYRQSGNQRVYAADDLGEIAQAADPKGFIGVVYADGNNMGALIESKLTTPDKYAYFATRVCDTLQDAVFSALVAYLQPAAVTAERGEHRLIHPFEILSIGGDDLFLIVPAQWALPIACQIGKVTEERLCQDALLSAGSYTWANAQRCAQSPDATTGPQSEVSLSAGVVLADAHTPVFYLEDLAGQLLKSAKRRAKWLKRERQYYGGTIDFLALKSVTMISGTVEQFRAAALTLNDRRLYARPYTIAEMEALLETGKRLKSAHFPRNQLYRLRESLQRSKEQSIVDYLYFLSRDKDVQAIRKEIETSWIPDSQPLPHPWRRQLEDEKCWETIWYDLVELYDFVPE